MTEQIDSGLKSVVKDTTVLVAGIVASTILWMMVRVIIIRSMTTEELGIYSLAVATASILAIIAGCGLYDGVTRYVALFKGAGKSHDAKAVSKTAIRIGLVTSIFTAVTLVVISEPIAEHGFNVPELATPLKVISLFVPLYVLSYIYAGILRGYGIVRAQAYYIYIGHPLFFLVVILVTLFLGLPFIGIIYAYVIAMSMVFISLYTYGYRKTGFTPFGLGAGGHRDDLFKFALPLLGSTVMQMILIWTDSFMLGRYMGPADVGIYNVSVTLSRVLTYGKDALVFVFMPLAASLYAKKEHEELKRTYQILTKWSFSVILPIFFVLFFFPEMTISFLFGERYIVSAEPLRILSLAFMSNVFMGVGGILLLVIGRSRTIMNITVFNATLNVLLNYILIKKLGYGVNGASWATGFTYFMGGCLGAFVCYRYSGIHPFRGKYLKPVVGLALSGLLIYVMAKGLPLYFWMLPLYFALFVGSYIALMLFTKSIDREDIMIIDAVSQKTGLEMKLIKRIIHKFASE
jgi:O-antigen/teichoic acid export membrane protein